VAKERVDTPCSRIPPRLRRRRTDAEEAVLDVSSAHGATHAPFPSGRGHFSSKAINGIGDRRDGRGSSDLALRGGEAQLDPVRRSRRETTKDQRAP